VRRLLVLPLYPQYSASTTASTFDALSRVLSRWRWVPELRFVTQYHDHGGYIGALAASVRESFAAHGEPEKLLMSFHGLPRRYLLAGDPYHCQCHKTARLLAEALELPEGRWQVSFQSRVGPEEWLGPYTDETVTAWGREGVKSLQILAPGFSADCLETLEEIDEQNREFFQEAGGGDFHYIPALNDRPDHVAAIADIVTANLQGWPEVSGDWSAEAEAAACADTRRRATAMGAAG
jgi:ferrochelatase